jgi:hypothetical protein
MPADGVAQSLGLSLGAASGRRCLLRICNILANIF